VSLWNKRPGRTALARSGAAAHPLREGGNADAYQALYVYLRDRFANRVVLTFAEIEALLGFSLPEAARLQREWWDGTDGTARGTAQSDAWTLASRTATVNMSAQSVLFERQTSLESLSRG
jgi:hypothetical protein